MNSADISRARRTIGIVLFGVLLAACSPAAPVAPSLTPSPVPTIAPTPSAAATVAAAPSAAPVASASAAAAPDPAIGLKVAAPYTLGALDPALEAAFRQQFAASAGAFGSLIGVGGRDVITNGLPVAYVVVIGFPAGIMSDAAYQSMLSGIASSSAGTLTKKTISGTEVSEGTAATGTLGFYRDGDNVIMVIAPKAADLDPVAKALIDANK